MIYVKDIPEDGIVFYDVETTSVYAPYCKLKMIAYQLGINSSPILVDPADSESVSLFRDIVGNPNVIKVAYNNINFDDIVLFRHGFYVNPTNRHDLYLALKTVHPTFPSYSLKFVNWALNIPEQSIDDAHHEPEAILEDWLLKHELGKGYMYAAPPGVLENYCKHDVTETVNVFLALWEKVQEPMHWEPYSMLELAMGEPLHEMMLLGKEYLNLTDIEEKIKQLEQEKEGWILKAREISGGKVWNVTSSKQVSKYLIDVDRIELDLSDKGNFQVRKSDLLDFLNLDDNTKDKNQIARCCYEARDAAKIVGYLRSYLRAGRYEQQVRKRISTNSQGTNGEFHTLDFTDCLSEGRDRPRYNEEERTNSDNQTVTIPHIFSLSSARTRRFQSGGGATYKGEKFRINWQNQNKRSKIVQLVPKGWIGFWLDSTQIENVVHIWASDDWDRRAAYEADPDWSEYVWLGNKIIGGEERNRKELEAIQSDVNPQWSIYKQYKTIKLALNFGMGPGKYSANTGLSRQDAERSFEQVHRACPAIRKLQHKVRDIIKEHGYVADPFGHIYSGSLDQVYKIVAFYIQGCGTGSVPKAMTIANYQTLHSYDTIKSRYYPYIKHPYTNKYSYGVLCGTTHDECAGRISLGLPTASIVKLIRGLLYNMEEKFSPLFDGIPLRAKLAVSTTNASEQIELNHRRPDFEGQLTAIINSGK